MAQITIQHAQFGNYMILRLPLSSDALDESNSILIQVDTDRTGLASAFGWVPCPDCRATDGTVDCAHRTSEEMIEEATDYLDDHIGEAADDPGYF